MYLRQRSTTDYEYFYPICFVLKATEPEIVKIYCGDYIVMQYVACLKRLFAPDILNLNF